MKNFVSIILNESIDIYHCNKKYGSESLPHRMEYWDIELHVCLDEDGYMLEKYAKKINEIFNDYNEDPLCYIIRPFCMTKFCEYLSEKISDLNVVLKLKKVIISPKKDKYYKFVWEKEC